VLRCLPVRNASCKSCCALNTFLSWAELYTTLRKQSSRDTPDAARASGRVPGSQLPRPALQGAILRVCKMQPCAKTCPLVEGLSGRTPHPPASPSVANRCSWTWSTDPEAFQPITNPDQLQTATAMQAPSTEPYFCPTQGSPRTGLHLPVDKTTGQTDKHSFRGRTWRVYLLAQRCWRRNSCSRS